MDTLLKVLIRKARADGWMVERPIDRFISCEFGGLLGDCREFSIWYIDGYHYCAQHSRVVLTGMAKEE